ncbi:MAG TPA: TonB-dependent hemoglobin/transferrin/lactoferrin family receptor [Steroidobacteraceae bacterium]|nr:TonB-dependent hemoglobin/transferrin/lactoferrin family receptor [Steroidobacteraceae bacterium]HNS26769.1 TonB-dependent hemoglobin/transferrin/lactoferrin family receptor [Steroidobacteraceae bacterium]
MSTPTFARPASLLLAVAAAPLAAQTVDLEVVTITATRIETRVVDVPATVTVKGREDMDRELVFDLKDLVRYEPGVTVSDDGGRFGLSDITIRGIGGNRVLMEVDGVRMPDAFSIGSYADAGRDVVDTDLLKRVEIVRGSVSSLYGSDAIGGVVAFTTKDPADLLSADRNYGFSTKAGYSGRNDSTVAGGTFAARAGAFSGLLAYTRRDGHETENSGDIGGVGTMRTEPVPQDRYSDSVLAKLVFDATDTQRLRLTWEGSRIDTFTDVLTAVSATPPVAGGTQTTGLVGSDEQQRSRITFDHAFPLGEWRVYRQESETSQETLESRNAATLAGVITPQTRWRLFDFEQEEVGAEVTLFSRFEALGAAHTLAYGAEYIETDTVQLRTGLQTNLLTGVTSPAILPDVFPVRDFPLTKTRRASIFVQDEISLGAWTITPGVRYDDYALRPTVDAIFAADNPGFVAADIDETNVSPKLGVMYRITEYSTGYFNYAAGFRTPPYDDANFGFENLAFGYTAIANPDLKSETSDSFELGWRLARPDGHYLALSAYYNLYDDFIESLVGSLDPARGLIVFQSQNLNEVRIRGVEVAAGMPLEGQSDSLRGLSVRLAASYARGENRTDDTPLNSIDPPKAVIGFAWRAPSQRWGAELVTTFADSPRRVDDSLGEPFVPPSYTKVDLLADIAITPQLRLNAGLFNLTDEKYWEWADVSGRLASNRWLDRYTRPGRTAGATIRYEW